jgi:type I restriction enzyme S subunit
MREGWKEVNFGDVVQFPPKISMKKGTIYPFIPMEALDSGKKYVKPKEEKALTSGGAKFEEGDTLFARITPCLQNGKISQAKNLNGKPGFGSTEYFIFRGKEGVTDTDFIYYLTLNKWFKDKAIGSMVGASGRQRADATFVRNIEIQLPPLQTQRKIASILSGYDDLIENNLKRIKLLEEKAQLTYEEWFVKLRFPGFETAVFDEVSELPEGWEKMKLSDVAEINSSSIKKNFDGLIRYIDIASVSPNKIDYLTEYEINLAPGRAKRIVKHGDIIWSCVRPNRRSHTVIWKPEDNLIASTGFCVITPKTIPTSYLYQYLITESFVGYLTSLASGAAYPAVKSIDFSDADVIIPSNDLLIKFNQILGENFDIIWNLQTQNRFLKEARDILLPRLMSGMVDVEELQIETLQTAE